MCVYVCVCVCVVCRGVVGVKLTKLTANGVRYEGIPQWSAVRYEVWYEGMCGMRVYRNGVQYEGIPMRVFQRH
jgi:hypothetical protein